MNLRAIYHLTGKFSTDCTGILFDQGRISSSESRMKSCCADEQRRVTYSLMPGIAPGRMSIFPSYLMHYVNPYADDAPRISLFWNISTGKIAGSPLPEIEAQREKLAAEK